MSKEESYKHMEMQEIIHYLEKTPIKIKKNINSQCIIIIK